MPPVAGLVGAIGTAVSAIQATAVGAWVFNAVVSFGAQSLLAKLMAPDVKPKGIKQKIEGGGDNPLSFILGEYATSGKLVYVNQTGLGGNELNNALVMVISVSELPIDSFSNNLYINGEAATVDLSHVTDTDSHGDPNFDEDAPGPGFYAITEYDKRDKPKHKHQYCWMKFYQGDQTTADPYLLAAFGADPDKPWTSDMIGRGCAYVIVVCRYSATGVWSGVPEFKFVAKGLKLYDPRKDTTVGGSGAQRWSDRSTWAWSENPKVMQYNIIRGITYAGDWIWGGQNVSAYQLPLSYWFAAMNHCDEEVVTALGAHINRYTAGGEVHVDQQAIDIIKELDKTCTGYTSEYGGLWKTWAGPPAASVFDFTDADIVITEEQTDNLFAPIQTTYNGAHATYVNRIAGWVMKDAPPRIFDDLQTADGGLQLIAEMQLPFVTNGNQAQRLMRAAVLDSRRQITHVMTLPPEAYILEPRDVSNWNSTRGGYVNKKFSLTSIEDMPNGNQLVAIRETNANDYDWDVSFELPDSVGPLVPIRPGALALDFTVSPDQVDRPGGGKDKPAIRIEWTWGAEDVDLDWVKYEVRRSSTQAKVIASGTFHNIAENAHIVTSAAFRFKQTFEVRLFAQPVRKGRDSSWTGWKSVTLLDIDVPGAPTLTRVSDLADNGGLNFFLDIDWTAASSEVFYTIRIVSGGRTFYRRSDENAYRLPVTSGKSYAVSIRAIAQDGGTKGDWSTATNITVTKKNTAPTTPSGLTVTGDNHRNRLAWTKCPDSDYKRTIIYRANVNNFLDASLVEVGRVHGTRFDDDNLANGITRYYWITHEDTSDNESAKYPSSNTGGIAGTTVRVVDDDTDATAPAAPGNPAISTTTGDFDGDGTADIGLTFTWTAPGSGVPCKRYVLDIYRSATVGTANSLSGYTLWRKIAVPEGQLSHTLPCNQAKFHKAIVRGVSFSGVAGADSSATGTPTGIQPTVYPNTMPTVAWVTPSGTVQPIVSRPRGIILRWIQIALATYPHAKEIVIYRHTANASGSAVEIDTVSATAKFYKDDDNELVVGTTYYYWLKVRDRIGQVSASFSAVQSIAFRTASASASIGDFDATALAAPSTVGPRAACVSFDQDNQDVNGDGAVDVSFTVSWVAPADAVMHNVEVSMSATSGGAFTVTGKGGTTPLTQYSFKANTNKYYKVRVQALNAYGQPGAWTTTMFILGNTETFSTYPGYKPAKKASFSPAGGVGTPVAVIKPKSFYVYWARCTDADYRETILYRYDSSTGTQEVARGKINGFVDHNDLVIGRAYQYSIEHVDTSGNRSSTSSLATAVTYRTGSAVAADADFDTTALAAPGSFTYAQDTSFDLNGDGAIDMIMKVAFGAVTNATSYEVEISRSTASGGTYTVVGLGGVINTLEHRHICNVNYWYKARVRARNAYGQPGTWTALSSAVQPVPKSAGPAAPTSLTINLMVLGTHIAWSPCTDPDYLYTRIYGAFGSGTTFADAHVIAQIAGVNTFFYYAVGTTFSPSQLWVIHVNRSGVESTKYPNTSTSPYGVGLDTLTGSGLTPGSVTTSRLDDNAASDVLDTYTAGSVGLLAATATTVQTCGLDVTDAYAVRFDLEFTNDDGSATRDFDVELFDNTTSIYTRGGQRVGNQGVWHRSFHWTGFSGAARTIWFKLTCANATTVKHRMLSYEILKR